jgi:hypothetical protein
MQPLNLLERSDKYYLGSGTGMIFAPRFPRWLEWAGFWDEVDIYNYQLAPLFTVAFLRGSATAPGQLLEARQSKRSWSPAELISEYLIESELRGREHRSVLPGGWFVSEWELENVGRIDRKLLAVAWSVQESAGLELSTVQASAGAVRFRRRLRDRRGERLGVEVAIEAPGDSAGASAYLSEGTLFEPWWECTPFPEKWRDGLATEVHVDGISGTGLVYLATASRLHVPAGGVAKVTLRGRVTPVDVGEAKMTGPLAAYIREEGQPPEALQANAPAVGGDPGAASRASWNAFFKGVPELSCSDPFITHYWYYRWYGLQLCAHEGGIGNLAYSGCCEGTGHFHAPIGYSAQCHARELRWLSDPERARGVILNFLAHQRESGQLQGRIYLNHLQGTDFYFADWGAAVLAVDAVHPELKFLRAVYRPLALYAEWLERERDPEGSGLIDVIDHYETGQEYMSRYMAVSDEADSEVWGNEIRLKGIDATVYAYSLQNALAQIAGRLHEYGESARWIAAAERTAEAIRDHMWDGKVGIFSDVDPGTMKRTGVKAAVSFYPYFTDVVGTEHLAGLRRHLLNPSEFWTRYPVPSTSADDPYYSPDAEWKGKRHNCPWNGRVWPMANSHVVEAIARAAIEHDSGLRGTAAELIRKFIRMMFLDGDPEHPNCYEHYNPDTGQPSLYRGYDDYQHSWVNDLIVKYVAGFRPAGGNAFVVDPFPFELSHLKLSGLPFQGNHIDIEIEGDVFDVRVNGETKEELTVGETAKVQL